MAPLRGETLSVSLGDIVQALGGELRGQADGEIHRIASLESARPGEISFIAHARFRSLIASTKASCLIVREDLADEAEQRGAVIVTRDPYLYYARLTRWWVARLRAGREPLALIHPSAVIGAAVQLHPSVRIGAGAVVDDGAVLAEGVQIGAQAHVGEFATLGAGTRLAARVEFGAACRMGERGLVHTGAVIGADGFGFAPFDGRWERIEQLGGVCIGNDVDIGANTCIDRGALDDTLIEDGVKLDNLIQIAHNVRIGAHTAMAGCVGVAGSARIGSGCTFGGAAMILGHLEIGDHVHISAASVVMSSILKPGQYSGVFPIDENGSWEKNAATLRQLHTLRSRLRALEKKINP